MRLLIIILIIVGLIWFFNPDLFEGSSGGSSSDEETSETSDGERDEEIAALRKEMEINIPGARETKSIPGLDVDQMIAEANATSHSNRLECGNDPMVTVQMEMEKFEAKKYEERPDLGWYPGETYETEDGNLIVIGNGIYDFPSLENTEDNSLIVARNRLLGGAILDAKANIISQLNATMDAEQYINYPNSGLAPSEKIYEVGKDIIKKQRAAERELASIKDEIELVSGAVVEAEEDELAGVGFGDRMGALIDAATKKLDETYEREDLSQQEKQRVEELKTRLQELEKRKQTLEADLENMETEFEPYKEAIVNASRVRKLARQTLFGTKLAEQFSCIDELNRTGAMIVKLVWSSKSQERATAVLHREKFEDMEATGEYATWEEKRAAIDTQEPTMGNFVDAGGNVFWYALAHSEQIPGLSQMVAQKTQLLAESMLVQSLRSEIALMLEAEQALITTSDAAESMTSDRFLGRLEASTGEIMLPGIGGRGGYVKDGDTQETVRYHLAKIDFDSALKSRPIIEDIEKLNTRFWTHQSVWRGTVAGMQAAGASTKNNPENFRRGFIDGAQGVLSEDENSSNQSNEEPIQDELPGDKKTGVWQRGVEDDF